MQTDRAQPAGPWVRVPAKPAAPLVLAAVFHAAAALGAAEAKPTPQPLPPAWYEGFALRRKITFDRKPARGDAVLLRLGTSRATQHDARDVRVVVESRSALPLEILEVGPGDTALLRFEVYEAERVHHVYLGSASAGRPRMPRQPPRGGLLLEVFELTDGSCDDWKSMERLLGASAKRLGFLAPRSVFLGFPPLGRTKDYVARYTGSLSVERDGPYAFETVSDGGSFFLIDGKVVASWPGFHGIGGYADPTERRKHSGRAHLTMGTHSIEYVVATRTGGIHLLGWALPEGEAQGGKGAAGKGPALRPRRKGEAAGGLAPERTRPVPPSSFVPWLSARLGPVETRERPAADFDWWTASDSGSDVERHDLAEVGFRFAGDLKGRRPRRVAWAFGDGQTAEGEEVRHVYLRHGAYEVRLEVEADRTLEATRTVVARFESLEPANIDALLERYHATTKGYDLEALPSAHLAQLVWLRSKDDAWKEDLWKSVEAWYRRGGPDGAGAIPWGDAAPGTRGLLERLGRERALDLLRRGAAASGSSVPPGAPGGPGTRGGPAESVARGILGALAVGAEREPDRLDARAWLARLDAWGPDAAAAARAEAALAELSARSGTGDDVRRAGIFLAEILLRDGKEKEAAEILRRAEGADGFRRFEGDRRISSGARRLAVDNLLRTKRLDEARDALERWEWELPADRLSGVLQIYRARLHLAEGRPAEALRELKPVERLEGAAPERPRALLVAADALVAKGDAAGARRKLEEVVRDYPHRPESREAARRLEASGAKPEAR